MKKNSVSPLTETRHEDIDAVVRHEIQHKRRKKIEQIYKRTKQEQETVPQKSSSDESSSDNDESRNQELKATLAVFKRFNIVKLPSLLYKKFHDMNEAMEKLGFYCATASYHYFYYSIILLTTVVFLIGAQNVRDAILLSRLFKEGFPMILIATSFLQTLFCCLTLIVGMHILRNRNFCALKTYLIAIFLNILVIASNMTASYYLAQKTVITSYLETYIPVPQQGHHNYKAYSGHLSNFLVTVQKEFYCCGSKGPLDYAINKADDITFLPLSCCTHEYASIRKEDKIFCYLLGKNYPLNTHRDKLMRKIVNIKGCVERIAGFLRDRNEFELILTVLLLVVFLLVILCTLWFRKHLGIVICEQSIRRNLNQHDNAHRLWGHVRSRLLGQESMNTTALNLLRKGIHKCNNKEDIRAFLSKCIPAKDLLIQEKPIDLAEDIITDNTIPGLTTSLTHVNVTKSEEYEAKLVGSTSLTALRVKENQDKALIKPRTSNQNLHEDYWIEERGAKRRKLHKISSGHIDKSVTSSLEAEKIPHAPCPSTSSIHKHPQQHHVHRKSLIKFQLQKHILKEQRLILAKIIGEFQEEQLQIENRKIKYAMSHKNVPLKEIMELNLEEPISQKIPSVEEIYLNKKATQTLIGPTIIVIDQGPPLEWIDEETSTVFPEIMKPTTDLPVGLKRGETYTYIAGPKIKVEMKDVGTVVHAEDLMPKEMQALGTQTVKLKPSLKKK